MFHWQNIFQSKIISLCIVLTLDWCNLQQMKTSAFKLQHWLLTLPKFTLCATYPSLYEQLTFFFHNGCLLTSLNKQDGAYLRHSGHVSSFTVVFSFIRLYSNGNPEHTIVECGRWIHRVSTPLLPSPLQGRGRSARDRQTSKHNFLSLLDGLVAGLNSDFWSSLCGWCRI